MNNFYSLKPFVIPNFSYFYKQYFSAMDWINMAEQKWDISWFYEIGGKMLKQTDGWINMAGAIQ